MEVWGFFVELEDFTLLLNAGVLLGAFYDSARKACDRDHAMVYRMQTFKSVSFNTLSYRPQRKWRVLL